MIKGAAFDMDGLMLDSERLTFESWQKVMDNHGFDYSFEVYKQTVGRRTTETAQFYSEKYGERFDYKPLREEANAHFRQYVEENGMPVKKGLFKLLDFLKANGIKTAVATSTSSQSAYPMLKKAGVYDYFDELVCGDSVTHGKPHPEVFLTAAKRLGLDPCDCIGLEDSINGIKSAYSAGMKAIMVPDLIEPTEEIKPMITVLCKDLGEVADYLADNNFNLQKNTK